MIRWLMCVVALLVSLCGTVQAQCPGGNCGGVTFRSPVTFGGWRSPAVRYAAPPVWTTVRVYDAAPVFLPPVEFVETLPIVERVEYIEPARVVQRVERVDRRSNRVNARPRLLYSGQARWTWDGDLREHMRREHGLSAATLAELSDSQVMILHDWEHDER